MSKGEQGASCWGAELLQLFVGQGDEAIDVFEIALPEYLFLKVNVALHKYLNLEAEVKEHEGKQEDDDCLVSKPLLWAFLPDVEVQGGLDPMGIVRL